LRQKGESTLGGHKTWFDFDVLRLNSDGKGLYLGEFKENDKIIVIHNDGKYVLYSYDLSNHFENNIALIEKFDEKKLYTAVYFDGEQKYYYLKRFTFEDPSKEGFLVPEHPESKILKISTEKYCRFEVKFNQKKTKKENEIIDAEEFISVKSHKAKGKRITTFPVSEIIELEPLVKEIENDENNISIDDITNENPEFFPAGTEIQMKLDLL